MSIFIDTNILLSDLDYLASLDSFALSAMTLYELENIKSNGRKSEELKYKSRKATRFLLENEDKYEVVNISKDRLDEMFRTYNLIDIPDSVICCAAYEYMCTCGSIVFETNDISCYNIAKNVLKINSRWHNSQNEKLDYTGFKEVSLDEESMAYFYEHQNENIYDLYLNEYLIIKDSKDEIVDTYRWNGTNYSTLYKKQIKSMQFEKLKPKDIYQSCLVDSIMSNTITAISAPAGAGKSLISLMCCMNLIETGQYDRVVILHNPTKTRGAMDLGYYSGSAIEKSLQNSVGHMLSTKFGDQFGVEMLIQQGKLKIVSMADCRGMEIRDNEILYITECQNTTIDLIKLALSRVSSGAKIIIEGDYLTQTDSYMFEGSNNGLKRVIECFKGHEEFGYVELQNIWRSKIARLCELL